MHAQGSTEGFVCCSCMFNWPFRKEEDLISGLKDLLNKHEVKLW